MSRTFLTSLDNKWWRANPISFNEFSTELPHEAIESLGWDENDILQLYPMINSEDLSVGLFLRNITKDGQRGE